MLFVQIGREVRPRDISMRHFKAAITGIIDNKFVVIKKQDGFSEVVRVDDFVMTEKIYSSEELKNNSFEIEEAPKKQNDFERFKESLVIKVREELIKKAGF